MTWETIAAIASMLALTMAFGYWGGQLQAMVKALNKGHEDHEQRLRAGGL